MMTTRRTILIVSGLVALFALLLVLAACAPSQPSTTTQQPPASSTATKAAEETSENDSIQSTSEEQAPPETSGTTTSGATGSTVLGMRIYTTGTDQAGKIPFTGGTQALQKIGVAPCIRCHGKNGQGVQGQGPNLVEAVSKTFTTQQLFDQAVTQGKDEAGKPLNTRMPKFQMSQDDLVALYTYVRTLK